MAEAIGHIAHSKAMGKAEHEGGASYYIQTTTFGKTFVARNSVLAFNLLLVLGLLIALTGWQGDNIYALLGWLIAGALLMATSIVGRALFYVLVIPTTMPGAFFWKNKGFEEHARDIGLANMPQVGVVPLNH